MRDKKKSEEYCRNQEITLMHVKGFLHCTGFMPGRHLYRPTRIIFVGIAPSQEANTFEA